jgi:hypothetical protein
MLEIEQTLATWRIADDPLAISPGEQIRAVRIHDHRKAYLDYVGDVSGGRGRVEPQDAGRLSVGSRGGDLWTFELSGAVLQGRFEMLRIAGDEDAWVLREIMDQ